MWHLIWGCSNAVLYLFPMLPDIFFFRPHCWIHHVENVRLIMVAIMSVRCDESITRGQLRQVQNLAQWLFMGVVLWVVLFENDGPHRKEKLPDFPFFFWSMRMDWERAACDHFYTCTFSAKNWPFSKLYEHHCEALMRQLSSHPKRQPHVNFSTWFWMGAILIFGLKQHIFLALFCFLVPHNQQLWQQEEVWYLDISQPVCIRYDSLLIGLLPFTRW